MNLKTNFLTQIQINQILKQILELNFVTRFQKQISNTTPKKKKNFCLILFSPNFPNKWSLLHSQMKPNANSTNFYIKRHNLEVREEALIIQY